MKILLKNLFIIILVLLYTGCDDGLSPNEVHTTEVKGFILESEGGIEVYSQFEGALSDTIAINVGDTLELSVHFLDHDGDEIQHEEEEGEEDELSVSGFNVDVAMVSVEEHAETGSDHHEMAIHIIGVSAGSTDFKLELMHDDHADYTSTNNVHVTVTSGN